MPASKQHLFEPFEIEYSKIGRALAHPARIRIIEILNRQGYTRNIDLSKSLHMSTTSISNHVKKLEDASLVQLSFAPNNCFQISLQIGAEEKIKDFVNDIF